MIKEEKEQIFNLLKAIDGNLNGYTRNQFIKMPEFSDDEIKKTEISTESEKSITSEEIAATNSQNQKNISESTENKVSETVSQPQSKSESHGVTIEEINAKILRCTRCNLARTRNNVVPGMGVSKPEVMVIGEGPGYDEDMQGLPFVGKAGKLLDKMLSAIQLDRNTNCYIANIVKCRPPENRDPLPEEQAACISFLEAQIHILKPKMILCMGRISGQKLLNTETPVGKLRGTFHDYHGIPVLVTYHPSALLRNEELKRPAWEDLKMFRRKLDEITGK